MAEEREVRRGAHIECEDDQGNPYTVVEWQAFVRQTYVNSEGQWKPGNRHFELLDGRPVQPLDKVMASFKVMDSGIIIQTKEDL